MDKILNFLCYILISCLSLEAAFEVNISPLPLEFKAQMIEMGTWKPGCPIGMERLRLVKFSYRDFSDNEREGEIVVLDAVAERVAHIFRVLYQHHFPIAQAKTIEHYQGSDKRSMAANNTSAFNFRPIAGKTLLSVHSYGVAIDVNPVQNPCIEQQTVSHPEEIYLPVQPAEGQAYLNRTKLRLGMVEKELDEVSGLNVVKVFVQNGFYVWGGNWDNPIDWQHFQPSRATAEWLAFMEPEDASLLFELYIAQPTLLNHPDVRDFDFQALYEKNREQFMSILQTPGFLGKSPEDAYQALKS